MWAANEKCDSFFTGPARSWLILTKSSVFSSIPTQWELISNDKDSLEGSAIQVDTGQCTVAKLTRNLCRSYGKRARLLNSQSVISGVKVRASQLMPEMGDKLLREGGPWDLHKQWRKWPGPHWQWVWYTQRKTQTERGEWLTRLTDFRGHDTPSFA